MSESHERELLAQAIANVMVEVTGLVIEEGFVSFVIRQINGGIEGKYKKITIFDHRPETYQAVKELEQRFHYKDEEFHKAEKTLNPVVQRPAKVVVYRSYDEIFKCWYSYVCLYPADGKVTALLSQTVFGIRRGSNCGVVKNNTIWSKTIESPSRTGLTNEKVLLALTDKRHTTVICSWGSWNVRGPFIKKTTLSTSIDEVLVALK